MSHGLSFTRGQLAQLLGVSTPTITSAIDDGAPGVQQVGGRGKASRIDGSAFIPWYCERERAKARAEAEGKSLSMQEAQLDIELKREKLAKERRENVPRGAFAVVLRDILTRVNIAMDQLPTREADGIIGITDKVRAVETLRMMMDQLRADLRAPEEWLPAPEEEQLELAG